MKKTILCVDDETNILSALKRILRRSGHSVLLAEGGQQGLELLQKNHVDLVISDMRMPEMDGAQFLAQVAQTWPDTIRILLTGYADLSSTIAAVNEGRIYRYISKPWEDNDLVTTVQRALELQELERERDRLLELTQRQNQELEVLNAELEDKVKQRTRALKQTLEMLQKAHIDLKKGYQDAVKVFANLIDTRQKHFTGHSQHVADMAHRLALRLGMNEDQAQDVLFAGLLHNIGMIGLPDALVEKPFNALASYEKDKYLKHPVMGESLLMALEPLRETARLIRHQAERFDGHGFPDRLKGSDIPLGARILIVATDQDALQIGAISTQRLSPMETLDYLKRNSGKRYDPSVVQALLEELGAAPSRDSSKTDCLSSDELREGMLLGADLVTNRGLLLLSRGYILDQHFINKIQDLESTMDERLEIHIKRRRQRK